MKLVELKEGAQHHPNRWPCRLAVCGQYEARQGFETLEATHVISIRRASRPYYPPKVAPEKHLVLEFEDTTDAAHPEAPTPAHLDAAMAFVDTLPADARLLVHCLQGLSRSTGLVLGLLARDVSPLRAGYLLHTARPVATPNMLMVSMWDERLGLHGELIKAAEHFPCQVWRHGDGLGNFPHRRKKGNR
jgi:predicted protein tyrosine phosphatase